MACRQKEMISFGCSVLSGSLDLKKLLTSYGLLSKRTDFLWLLCSLRFFRSEEDLGCYYQKELISYGCSVLFGSLDLKKLLTSYGLLSKRTDFLWLFCSLRFFRSEEDLGCYYQKELISYGCSVLSGSFGLKKILAAIIKKN